MSLFSSIGYVRTPERLVLAVCNMARHVRPGGVLIVEPYFTPQAWKPRTRAPGANIVDDPEITIVRMVDWVREADVVKFTFHYLVGRQAASSISPSRTRMGLFSDDQHQAAFAAAGMAVMLDEEGLMGRGLYIGTWAAEAKA